jgi:hypothetical protein
MSSAEDEIEDDEDPGEPDDGNIDDELVDFSKDPCLESFWTTTIACGVCRLCKATNHVSLGDMDDQTAPNVEVVQCWNCNTKLWLDSNMRSEATPMGYTSIEDGYCVKGRKSPG